LTKACYQNVTHFCGLNIPLYFATKSGLKLEFRTKSDSHNGHIDTLNGGTYITPDRIDAFQFTNPLRPIGLYALYSLQMNQTKLIQLQGIAAGVFLDVYILTIAICFLLVTLFTFIECLRPSKKFSCWDVATAVLPCFNSQGPALEHSNSPARCVAIIAMSIFVFLCTTYYQTLLLSKKEHRPLFLNPVQ
jgi:hypothetical protein